MCVLIFSITFVRNFSYPKKNSAGNIVNPLAPNDTHIHTYIYIYIYICRTAQLTRRCILNTQQIYLLNILNMLHILRFSFFLFKMPFIS